MNRSPLKKYICCCRPARLLIGIRAGPAPSVAHSFAIEEIVVTARQRSESLQDVPASITAFTSEQLQRAGVQRAADFINSDARRDHRRRRGSR